MREPRITYRPGNSTLLEQGGGNRSSNIWVQNWLKTGDAQHLKWCWAISLAYGPGSPGYMGNKRAFTKLVRSWVHK